MSSKFDRNKVPSAGKLLPFNFPRFKRFICDNRMKVLLVEHNTLPLINFELCFKASPLIENAGLEGLASLTANLMSEGTTSRNSEQIANDLEHYGIDYSAQADWDSIHFSLSTLSKYSLKAFSILADILQNPVFPEKEIERVKKERIADRQRTVDSLGKVVTEQFAKMLYGDYRYATPLRGSINSLKNIRRENIVDFYDKYFHFKDAVLLVTGDINEEELKTLIKSNFTKPSNPVKSEIPLLKYNPGSSDKVRIIHKEGAQQSEVLLGHLGINRSNPDHYTVLLLNQILGGYFLSRLNMNLRQDKGFTYGISSGFGFRKITGPFSISAAVHSENTAEAIDEILKEVKKITSESVTDEELANAKGYFGGVFPIAFETAEQILYGLATIESHGLDDDYFRTFREKINQVSKEDILKAAQKYLHPDNFIIVAGGDKTLIEKQLTNKYIIETYDLNGNILTG